MGIHRREFDDGRLIWPHGPIGEPTRAGPLGGFVTAPDGTRITWAQADDGSITAKGEHNEQLVVSHYQPRRPRGTDPWIDRASGGGVLVGTEGPTAAGGGGEPGVSVSDGEAPQGEGARPATSEDGGWGVQFAYSWAPAGMPQGDPYLVMTQWFDAVEQVILVGVTGSASSAKFRMDVSGGDDRHVPTQVTAKFGNKRVTWTGIFDLTQSPIKRLAAVPGWRLDAFKTDFTYAAHFDNMTEVISHRFGWAEPDATEPGVIAKKTVPGIIGRAVIIGGFAVAGAAAVSTAPLTATVAAYTFLGGAGASLWADLWSSVTDDIEEVEAEAPEIDIPVTEEPDDGCFAEGTVVLQPGGRRTPIERIGTGDLVASRQEASLVGEDRGVTHTWRHEGKRTIDLTLDTGESVRTTAPHQFFTADRGLVPAGVLRVGDRLQTLDGAPRTIVVVKRGADATVYNLTVAESHTFFVGEAGVWVHNDKATTHDDAPPPDDDDEGEQPTSDDDDSSGGSGSSAGSGSGTGGGTAPPPA